MRIITGRAKGCPLKTLQGDATRPTSQRVKEAVFSILQFDIEGRMVLDLFAGSGQMSLEALSRGARHAVMVERSRDAVKVIRENMTKSRLGELCELYENDFRRYLLTSREKFDLVFLDPPYAEDLIPEALSLLFERKLIKGSTLIVCESGKADVFGGDELLASRFVTEKQVRYSKSYVTILHPCEVEAL